MEVADGDSNVHRFNAELPYKERLPAENERLLSEVKEALASFPVHGDVRRVFQACSGAYALAVDKHREQSQSVAITCSCALWIPVLCTQERFV